MATKMKHGNYVATIDYDPDLGKFFGEVINISDVVTFYGSSVAELRREFARSINAHLAYCKKKGIQPSERSEREIERAVRRRRWTGGVRRP